MDNTLFIAAAARVTSSDVSSARLGSRFGRLDLASQLVLLAVESLSPQFEAYTRDRIVVCLAARAGSLATDMEYWSGRDIPGGPSPTLFAYTLPSAAIGEIAIRHRLTGPGLCFVGGGGDPLVEAADLLRRGESDAALCVSCNVVTQSLASATGLAPSARACALFLAKREPGMGVDGIGRDIESLCDVYCDRKSAG